jgi:hypothetical protein
MGGTIRIYSRENVVDKVDKRIEFAKRRLVAQRNYRRIRDRALAKLANAHPQEYLALLEKERESDEVSGKKWLDITGNTGVNMGVESYKDTIEGSSYTNSCNEGENTSDNGGEA